MPLILCSIYSSMKNQYLSRVKKMQRHKLLHQRFLFININIFYLLILIAFLLATSYFHK